ncbi:MAG: 30S ribosomal protein S13 [Candidatus Micrarchaeia archaeon]
MGKSIKKENKEKSQPKVQTAPAPKKKKGIKGIIRIAGSDMFGEVPLRMAVMKVRGVGHSCGITLSRVISEKLNVSLDTQVGDLSEEQMGQIDKILENICDYLPPYMFNRRKDPEDGKDRHVITNDLIFANRQDIEKEKKVYSWKGYRHAYGKKVRGQRTKNTGRHGKAVGVSKKSLIPQKGAAASPAKKEEKK